MPEVKAQIRESVRDYFARFLKNKGVKFTKTRPNELIILHAQKADYVKVMNLAFDLHKNKVVPAHIRPWHVLYELLKRQLANQNNRQANFNITADIHSTKISFQPIVRLKDVRDLNQIGAALLIAHSGDEKEALKGINGICPQDAINNLNGRDLRKAMGITLDLSKYHLSQKVRRAAFDLYTGLLLEYADVDPSALVKKSVLSNGFRNLLTIANDVNHEHTELAKIAVDEVKDAAANSSYLKLEPKLSTLLKSSSTEEVLRAHKRVMGEYERNRKLH